MKKFRFLKFFSVFVVFFFWYELTEITLSDDVSYTKPKKMPKLVLSLYKGNFMNKALNGDYKGWSSKQNYWSNDKNVLPYEISTKTFPSLGVYSSHDESIIKEHLLMMRQSGIDGAVLMWDGHNHSNNGFLDKTLDLLFEHAKAYDVKIGIQIINYENMSSESIYDDIRYYVDKYKDNEMMLKIDGKPFIVIYEPFYIAHIHETIKRARETKLDCFFVSTFLENEQLGELLEDDFDAVFTYFASESFKGSSTIKDWKSLRSRCDERGIGLIAAVAPGYNEKSNDWTRNINRKREDGRYYDNMWKAAIDADIDIVIINSFNGWDEGTNIEPANHRKGYEFNDDSWHSSLHDSDFYLSKTAEWVDKFYQN